MESALCGNTHILDGIELGGKEDQPIITCSHDRQFDKNIFVWGDSHARHLLPGLVTHFPAYNIHILCFTGCLSQSGFDNFIHEYGGRTALKNACIDRNRRAMQFFLSRNSSTIIIHQSFRHENQFSEEWYKSTRQIITSLTEHGSKVAFIGGVPILDVFLAECISVPKTIPDWLLTKRCKGNYKVQKEIYHLNHTLKNTTGIGNHFISPNEVFCANEMDCLAVEKTELLYRDKHHLTLFGSRKLIGGIKSELLKLLVIE